MDNFRANQRKLQETWQASMGPDALASLAETNMAMFKAAASAFMPGAGAGDPPSSPTPTPHAVEDDIEALREQMAEMQRKLDKLGK